MVNDGPAVPSPEEGGMIAGNQPVAQRDPIRAGGPPADIQLLDIAGQGLDFPLSRTDVIGDKEQPIRITSPYSSFFSFLPPVASPP